MKEWVCLLALLSAGCGNDVGKNVEQRPEKPTLNKLSLPTRQQNGAPLTAAFCDTEKARQIYGNQKGCVLVACDGGDKQSCEIAKYYSTSLGSDDGLTKAPPNPAKLERMRYLEARPIILGYGWKPLAGGCSGGGVDTEICGRYPEIGNCQGTWPAFCDMTFEKPDRCLMVVTFGGSPSEDTVIRDVTFTRGSCKKDPN